MKYYIIAGEASGDLHGSNLMKGLYAQDPLADIRFWGGELMNGVYKAHQEGKGLVRDYRDTAVMGFWEVLLKGASIARNVRDCKADIAAWKPDVVILIDYPGFNLKIAEFAHEAGFKVYYYIAPKVWASREGRIRKIKAWVDRLFIIFPFEIPYFDIDQSPALQESREAFLRRTGVPDTPYIALLAGSRNMEIGSMMPTFMQFADVWHAENPSCHFVVAAAPSRTLKDYEKYVGGRPYVHVVFGETYGALRHAQAAIINSGTASLEAALIGTPQIVGYQALSRYRMYPWPTLSLTVWRSKSSSWKTSLWRTWWQKCAGLRRTPRIGSRCAPTMRKSVAFSAAPAPPMPLPKPWWNPLCRPQAGSHP